MASTIPNSIPAERSAASLKPGAAALSWSVEIQGLPLLGRDVLTAKEVQKAIEGGSEAMERLARSLRGQYGIIARRAQESWAITDWVGSYPVYYCRGQARTEVASSVCALIPFSRQRVCREALFSYVRYSGMVGEESLVDGIRRLAPGTIARFDGEERSEMHGYVDWRALAVPGSWRMDEAVTRLCDLADDYLGTVQKHLGAATCCVSSGTDSTFLAGLLHARGGTRTRYLIADYRVRRYSEWAEASANARHLGFHLEPVRVGFADYRKSLSLLNAAGQDAPSTNPSTAVFLAMAAASQKCGTRWITTGDHADALFLGFDEWLALLETRCGADVTALSTEEKLAWALPEPKCHSEERACLRDLNLSEADYRSWLKTNHDAARQQTAALAKELDLWTLLQVLGQAGGGIPWQHNFLPVERATGTHFISPFYDLELLKFAFSLPAELKIAAGRTKPVMREALRRRLGRDLAKRAMPIPLRLWSLMNGPLSVGAMHRKLRHPYLRACASNYAGMGRGYFRYHKLAALGIWLKSQGLDF